MTTPFKPLHPTLKKCKCNYIGTKRELYKHFDDTRRTMKAMGEPAREFFVAHGEVPLNADDPRVSEANIHNVLAESLNISRSEAKALNFADNLIPDGHRLDDNNTQYPTK